MDTPGIIFEVDIYRFELVSEITNDCLAKYNFFQTRMADSAFPWRLQVFPNTSYITCWNLNITHFLKTL